MINPGEQARKLFPIFDRNPNLAYLDTAASAQKPRVVIERLSNFLSYEYANIHRGAYRLSAHASEAYAQSRRRVAEFLNAGTPDSIVFTRNATEGVNLVAHALENYFSSGDVILLTELEHHSNIVPWQLLAARKNLTLRFVKITSNAELDLKDLSDKLKEKRPKLVALSAHSNAFGTVVPVGEIAADISATGALLLLDAAQAVVHGALDLSQLKADFLVFSSHKLYGPTGVGVLYVRPDRFELMEPFQGGGDMIEQVTVEGSTWARPPQKFEAGTPAIAEVVALKDALDLLEQIGVKAISEHERQLFEYAWESLAAQPGLVRYGPACGGEKQAAIIAFNVLGVHPHDVSTIADSFDVQLRAGHHCAMPALKRLGLEASARISFGVYNRKADIDRLIEALSHVRKLFG